MKTQKQKPYTEHPSHVQTRTNSSTPLIGFCFVGFCRVLLLQDSEEQLATAWAVEALNTKAEILHEHPSYTEQKPYTKN